MFHLGLAAHVCSPYTALIDWNVWLNGSGMGGGGVSKWEKQPWPSNFKVKVEKR